MKSTNGTLATTLRFQDCAIRVESKLHNHLEWLVEFLTPHFVSRESVPSTCSVELIRDVQAFQKTEADFQRSWNGERVDTFVLDRKVIRLSCWRRDDGTSVLFDDTFGVFYLIGPGIETVQILSDYDHVMIRMPLMRVIREVAISASHLRSDSLILHAASAALNGRGLIITGPKGAGKTTLLTYLLGHHSASYVSNDRVLMRLQGTRVEALGIPSIVSVKRPTVEFFPEFKRWKSGCSNSFLSTLEELEANSRPSGSTSTGKMCLSPAQFCGLLKTELARGTMADILLFPSVRKQYPTDFRRLSMEESAARLLQNLFARECGSGSSSVFSRRVQQLDEVASPSLELCRKFASSLHCIECRLGPDSYREPRADFLTRMSAGSRTFTLNV